MQLDPKDNNLPLLKFESMLKTNSVFFFDSIEFEEIIQYYMDIGKSTLAKKAVKLALEQHPVSVNLKLMKAELLIFDNKLDEAEKLLNNIEALEPTNDEVYIQKATVLSKKDDHQNAINSLKKALAYTDDQADIFSLIGMEYLYLDKFEDARFNFIKCLEVDFDDYSSLYNIVYCFDMESKHIEAIEYLNDYINKDPFSEVAWHQLGRQYFILEKFEEALKSFDYAVLVDEFFVGAYLEKAKTLEELKRYEEAIENYLITVELDDPTSFVFLRVGECYYKLNEYKLAIRYYKKALNEDPILDKGWLALTNIYFSNKNYEKALYYIQKALEIDDSNTIYLRKYAEINIKINFFEEAVKALKKCIELNDIDLENWIAITDIQIYLGDFNDALATSIKGKTLLNNSSSQLEYRIAGLYFLFSDPKNAYLHLDTALKLDYKNNIVLKELFPLIVKELNLEAYISNFKNN